MILDNLMVIGSCFAVSCVRLFSFFMKRAFTKGMIRAAEN